MQQQFSAVGVIAEPETVEANWIDVIVIGSSYEEQIDANSEPTRSRHRLRRFTGDFVDDWKEGPAPRD